MILDSMRSKFTKIVQISYECKFSHATHPLKYITAGFSTILEHLLLLLVGIVSVKWEQGSWAVALTSRLYYGIWAMQGTMLTVCELLHQNSWNMYQMQRFLGGRKVVGLKKAMTTEPH